MDYKADEEQGPAMMEDEETFFDYDDKAYPHKVWGDVLAILGGMMYGAMDVIAELSSRQFGGPMEFLALMGAWGIPLTATIAVVSERDEMTELWNGPDECSVSEAVTLLSTYVISLTLHMVGVSYFVLFSEAALLNISLLTMNFYAVGFSVLGDGSAPEPMFYVALTLISLGIFIYEVAPSPVPADETPVIKQMEEAVAEEEEMVAVEDMNAPMEELKIPDIL